MSRPYVAMLLGACLACSSKGTAGFPIRGTAGASRRTEKKAKAPPPVEVANYLFEVCLEEVVEDAEGTLEPNSDTQVEVDKTLEQPSEEMLICIEKSIIAHMPTIAEKYLESEKGLTPEEVSGWGKVEQVTYESVGSTLEEVTVTNSEQGEEVKVSKSWREEKQVHVSDKESSDEESSAKAPPASEEDKGEKEQGGSDGGEPPVSKENEDKKGTGKSAEAPSLSPEVVDEDKPNPEDGKKVRRTLQKLSLVKHTLDEGVGIGAGNGAGDNNGTNRRRGQLLRRRRRWTGFFRITTSCTFCDPDSLDAARRVAKTLEGQPTDLTSDFQNWMNNFLAEKMKIDCMIENAQGTNFWIVK